MSCCLGNASRDSLLTYENSNQFCLRCFNIAYLYINTIYLNLQVALNKIEHRISLHIKSSNIFTLLTLQMCTKFYVLLTVHPNIMIFFFFTNLMHKFFILIHFSTCFEHFCAHLQDRLREESSRNLCTEQSPKESDDTRCCVNTTVLLKMSTIMLETCRGM